MYSWEIRNVLKDITITLIDTYTQEKFTLILDETHANRFVGEINLAYGEQMQRINDEKLTPSPKQRIRELELELDQLKRRVMG